MEAISSSEAEISSMEPACWEAPVEICMLAALTWADEEFTPPTTSLKVSRTPASS
jgi:hypothetical protein